ncbi:hypothetical protein EON63_00830 [archaeon]|nr:MAG: hypothetical protein EON63_00830 [archaeon]
MPLFISVGVSLYGAMRASYPGEAALLVHCLPAKGLSSSLVDELNASLTQTAADSLGMPSIYTMAEAAREWLQVCICSDHATPYTIL